MTIWYGSEAKLAAKIVDLLNGYFRVCAFYAPLSTSFKLFRVFPLGVRTRKTFTGPRFSLVYKRQLAQWMLVKFLGRNVSLVDLGVLLHSAPSPVNQCSRHSHKILRIRQVNNL